MLKFGDAFLGPPPPLSTAGMYRLLFKDDVKEFSSISDSSFMARMDSNLQCTIERKQRDCTPGSHQSVMQLRPHSLITL